MTLYSIGVKAPSNIAFVKYWGKKGRQLPLNPSLSMTLKNCHTQMWIDFKERGSDLIEEVYLNDVKNDKFKASLEKKYERLLLPLPWLKNYSLVIKTKNTFPHSAGIASSASSMAALSYAIEKFANHLGHPLTKKQTSENARLLSGSASRSIFSGLVSWGDESENWASIVTDIHPLFHKLYDSILIVDQNEKKVSSSEGHALIENHPYREGRVKQANDHFQNLKQSLKNGDFHTFDKIVTAEALSLHALMMSSHPSYTLLKPNTLKLIELIDNFKQKEKVDLTYTLDAGPNLHLIYTQNAYNKVQDFIKKELIHLCEDQKVIHDEVGMGPAIL